MSATYRTIQSSFSAGELDPMTSSNYNLAYRQYGLRESYNTLHLPNATVCKRPGLLKELPDNRFGSIDSHGSWTVIELQTSNGDNCTLYLGKRARILYAGAFYDKPIYGSKDMDGSNTIELADGEAHYSAVFQQTVFITDSNAVHGFYALMLGIADNGEPYVYRVDAAASFDDISDMGRASTLAVANGRLWIAERNILAASRSRTIDLKQDEDGFPRWMMDFTLADYTSTATYRYHKDNPEEGGSVDETVYYACSGKAVPDDPYSDMEGIEKRTRTISMETADIAGTSTEYAIPAQGDYPEFDAISISLAYKDEYTVTDNYMDGKVNVTDISRKRTVLDSFIRFLRARDKDIKSECYIMEGGYVCFKVPYDQDRSDEVRVRFDGHDIEGWIDLCTKDGKNRHTVNTANKDTIYTQTGTDGEISYRISIGSTVGDDSSIRTVVDYPSSSPDISAYPSTEEGIANPVEKDSMPSVYSTHGIQIQENDMYGSSIRWIASAGRLIVGTDTAIFMAVDQYADPSSFDLVITSYTGTSAIQPKVLNQFIVFTSLDRKKLYVGVYSDEQKGLQISEATEHVTHMFLSGIKDYYITDTPYRAIYVITEDGHCRVCIPTITAEGMMFAWSTWDFGPAKAEYIAFDRKNRKTYLVMEMEGEGYIYTLDYREPYLYGESDVAMLLDYAETTVTANQAQNILIDNPMLISVGKVQMMSTYPDGRSVISRDKALIKQNDKYYVRYLPPSDLNSGIYPSDVDVVIRIGMSYDTRISLYQQVMPNNSGYSLMSRHSIERIYISIFRSQGGAIWHGRTKIKDILQLVFGRDKYNSNGTDPDTGKPYSFTGIYAVDDPVQNTEDDVITISSSDPYPLNVMAVAFRYKLTEIE